MDFSTLLLCLTFAGLGITGHIVYRSYVKKTKSLPLNPSPLNGMLSTLLPLLINSGMMERLLDMFAPKFVPAPVPDIPIATNQMFTGLTRDPLVSNPIPRKRRAQPVVDFAFDAPAAIPAPVQVQYFVSNKSHVLIRAGEITIAPEVSMMVFLDNPSPAITLGNDKVTLSSSFSVPSGVLISFDVQTKMITVSTDNFQRITVSSPLAEDVKAVLLSGGFAKKEKTERGTIFTDVSYLILPNGEKVCFRDKALLTKHSGISVPGYECIMKRTSFTEVDILVAIGEEKK